MTTSTSSAAESGLLQTRKAIEAEIERLIALLDEIDGDADMEQTARESQGAGFGSDPHSDDSEDDDDGMADQGGYDEQWLRANGIFHFVEEVQS